MDIKDLLVQFAAFVDENDEEFDGDAEGMANKFLEDNVVNWEEMEVESLGNWVED